MAPMLPHMAESSDGGHVASGGTGQLPTKKHKLPPFIIVEKGEALDEFVQRAQPDMYQSVAVCVFISQRKRSFVNDDAELPFLPFVRLWCLLVTHTTYVFLHDLP